MYLSCTDGVLLLSFVVYARNLSKLPVYIYQCHVLILKFSLWHVVYSRLHILAAR